MTGDIDMMGPHEERRLLAQIERRPWREAFALALADSRPALYARLTDPGQAAILSLLGGTDGERCLDATGGWGQVALPLARRARVTVLATSAVHAAIVRKVAAQEGVAVDGAVGRLETGGFATATFDLVLWHDVTPSPAGAKGGESLAALREAARLLRPGGRVYVGAPNDLAAALGATTPSRPADVRTLAQFTEIFALAGLQLTAAYACFPDHLQPRFLVPLTLVDQFIRTADAAPRTAWNSPGLADIYARLAGEGIARHFAPSFAFILRADGRATAAAEAS